MFDNKFKIPNLKVYVCVLVLPIFKYVPTITKKFLLFGIKISLKMPMARQAQDMTVHIFIHMKN